MCSPGQFAQIGEQRSLHWGTKAENSLPKSQAGRWPKSEGAGEHARRHVRRKSSLDRTRGAYRRPLLPRNESSMFKLPSTRIADAAAEGETKRTFARTTSGETPLRAVRTLERTLTPRLEATEVFRACIVRDECE